MNIARLLLIRHPRTRQDPTVPASAWDLSDAGRAQVAELVALPVWDRIATVYTSPQRKAAAVGEALHRARNTAHEVVEDLTEARRDIYLPTPEAFDAAQRAFFAQPDTPPVAGWETAESAGARFIAAMNAILSRHPAGESLAVVGHATVFALYVAHLRGARPSVDVWREIGFAAIMVVDRATLRPLTPFVGSELEPG